VALYKQSYDKYRGSSNNIFPYQAVNNLIKTVSQTLQYGYSLQIRNKLVGYYEILEWPTGNNRI
jgi:hypothetical protein